MGSGIFFNSFYLEHSIHRMEISGNIQINAYERKFQTLSVCNPKHPSLISNNQKMLIQPLGAAEQPANRVNLFFVGKARNIR